MKFLFRTLVNQNHRLVYSQALHILANKSDAEDATQEAYERLWKHMNNPQKYTTLTKESGKAWLLHVVRNRCIDKLRQRKPSGHVNIEELHCDNPRNQPVANLAKQQLSDWLRNAIDRLQEPYRSLIILADLKQHTIKDVANTLDLNENQVKVYIHRARKQLRGHLQGVEL